MTHKFLKIAGVKDEASFYKKFPTEDAFFKAHPDALPTYENVGSIHINPENKGKFNATKKATGKTTEELTHSSNPITKKRAVFAQNASHFKHADGGTVPSKDINTGEFLNTRLGLSNDNVITPLPQEESTGGCTDAKGNPIPCPPGVKNGTVIVDNPNNPRYKAYNDSLSAYNLTQNRFKQALDKGEINDGKGKNIPVYSVADRQYLDRKQAINSDFEKYNKLGLNLSKKDIEEEYKNVDYKKGQVKDDAIGYYRFKHKNDAGTYTLADYKKPVQSVVYQKPQPNVQNYVKGRRPLTEKEKEFWKDPKTGLSPLYANTKSLNGKETWADFNNYPKEQPEKIFPMPAKAQAKINITSPQPYTDPVPQGDYIYGPANSVIGINSKDGFVPWSDDFDPTSNKSQRGKVNKADSDLLQNPEELKKYLKTKGLKNGGKLKAAWGASLGTDPFVGGPDPIKPLNLNGQAFIGADGKPVSTSPSVWDTPQPIPQGGYTPGTYGNQKFMGSIPVVGDNPAWANYPSTPGGTPQPIPINPNAPKMYSNPDYIPNQGEGNLNRGQVPNLTEGQKKWDKTAVKPYQDPQVKPPKNTSWNADGSAGDVALTALMAVDAFMPKEKIRRRYVRPEDMQSYNANTYGTGSQAISEYGSTLKGKKKAFWGAALSAVGGKAGVASAVGNQAVGNQAVGTASSGIMDTIKQGGGNLTNNIAESVAPLMQISHKADAEAQRINQAYLNGELQDVSKLQAPQQFLPNQQPQYMANGGEMKFNMGGELQTGEGGNTKLKAYNPWDGGTMQFDGQSHEQSTNGQSGIAINFNGEKAEVEGGETAFKDQEGNLKIMGNLKNPLTGRKYKDDLKKIAKKEERAQKLMNKGVVLLNTASPEDPFEQLAFNAGKAMTMGSLMKQKELSDAKQHLGNMQEAHLEIAMEKKKSPENLFKDGGTMYAEDGITLGDPEPKKKWVYRGTNTKKLDAKIKTFADMLAANDIEGYSGEGGGYRKGAITKSGRKSGHGSNRALDAIPVMGEAAYQKILDTPSLVKYLMENGLTVLNEYDAEVAKQTGATAGHLHIGYDKGTKVSDKFRQDAISLYPNLYDSEPKYKMNDANGEMYTAKELAQTYGFTKAGINKRIKNGILTALPGITSQNYKQPPLNQGVGDAHTENFPGYSHSNYAVPPVNFQPVAHDVQIVQGNDTPIDLHQPAPYNKPSNARGINPLQFLGEGYAMATNQEEPVKAQLYTPELYSPYQVSFQDRLNENQSTFNSVEKQLAYDPTSLATLAGQKYSADSNVLADEFRTNQTIANDIVNKNVSLLNEAEKTNLGILDQQYTRQTQAKANTKRINQDALSSISSKLLQKEASNNALRVYENLYQDYSFDPHTGKALFQGPKQGEEKPIDYGVPQPITAGQPSKTVVKTNPAGQKTTTDTYEFLDPNAQFMESLGIKPKKKTASTPISIYQMFKNNRR